MLTESEQMIQRIERHYVGLSSAAKNLRTEIEAGKVPPEQRRKVRSFLTDTEQVLKELLMVVKLPPSQE